MKMKQQKYNQNNEEIIYKTVPLERVTMNEYSKNENIRRVTKQKPTKEKNKKQLIFLNYE